MAERSFQPDWELRSKVVRLIYTYASNYSTPDCKKNQQGSLSQGNSNLQWPLTYFYGGALKKVFVAHQHCLCLYILHKILLSL